MEQRGVLKSWNDEKGFGFIQPEQGGEQLFVHISAMRGDRRPAPGETVLFLAEPDRQGRLRARHMRFDELTLDRPAIRRKPRPAAIQPERPARRDCSGRSDSGAIRNLPLKSTLFLGLCALPVGGALQILQRADFVWPLCAYGLLSLIGFFLYWGDKNRAEKGGWRTPENTLHAVELLGGWPGALLAQQVFRHKTRKVSYQAVFWGIVGLHQAFWGDWLLLGGKFVRQVLPQLAGFM
ncbi:Uncharacterized membrane protein YsdA, DUF1294 family [Azotobacter beijerinckii]|uniref:Uncharacterized membrane protein YsdA, DUF1294 family n=1 Tax=Azotobacter beijerinckii TaxID=170623 RepID=A0A1H8Z7G7_9GAMM|nr:cold shock and DUF1294 domain-containing protein [Azotobacter beijerinckii]SEP60380.1 Uncharacterized membrane protein YsdA, DUF1294 family [Azotobacter beijerinckii]